MKSWKKIFFVGDFFFPTFISAFLSSFSTLSFFICGRIHEREPEPERGKVEEERGK